MIVEVVDLVKRIQELDPESEYGKRSSDADAYDNACLDILEIIKELSRKKENK